MEALKVNLNNVPVGASIKYESHVQNIGWQSWVSDGQESGTTGRSLRMEAIKITLENMPAYSVEYRCHVQNIGWQNWVRDGVIAGTEGRSLRVEAIEIRIVALTDMTTYNTALASKVEANYTPESWTTYQNIVAANVVTVSNIQAEVDTATGNITAAQGSLVTVVDANLAAAKPLLPV